MKTLNKTVSAFALLAMLSTPALALVTNMNMDAETAPVAASAMAEAPSVPMASGGIGEEVEYLRGIQNKFNVKLLFTQGNGMYLSDVNVRFFNKKNEVVAETVTDGPILLVKLPAGTYKVVAVQRGEERTLKVTAGAGLHSYQVRYSVRDTETSE